VVDALNAQDRVKKIGGKVVYRDEADVVGADLVGSTNETVERKENVVAVLNSEKTGEKKVVSRHQKKVTFDAILVNESEQDKDLKDEKKVVSRHETSHSTDTVISDSKGKKKKSEE